MIDFRKELAKFDFLNVDDELVLEMFEGVLDVKASSGNNQLGGKDFDQRLMDYLLDRFTFRYKADASDN